MKKIIALTLSALVLLVTAVSLFMVKSEKIILRSPIVIQQDIVITYVIGKVRFKVNGEEEWQNCIVGTKLEVGSEIRTGKASLADIRFHAGTAIRLNENSHLKIDQLTVKNILVRLDKGSVHGRFKKLFDRHQIRIQTPTTIASIRGTELAVEVNLPEAEKDEKEKKEPQVVANGKTGRLKGKSVEEKSEKEEDVEKNEVSTTVYNISGIIEVTNPMYQNQSLLLSNQKKSTITLSSPPANPEDMSSDEIMNFQSKLNSLHFNEVLLITNKIYFETGSAGILPESFPELDKIAEILKKRSEDIMIEGHTDDTGPAYENQELSVRRSRSIQEYLVKHGVEDARLMISGYGESKPIAGNDTEEGRALNRRVEFIIMK